MTSRLKTIVWLSFGTVLAMVPEYLIRFKESVYLFLYYNLSTYPGDLWNFFVNYLGKGAHYPMEYPAGLRFFYEIMQFYTYKDYTTFYTVNWIILAAFAIATTALLYTIVKKHSAHESSQTQLAAHNGPRGISRMWYFWIFAPSLILYGTINYDLPVVFLVVLAVYLFLHEKHYLAVSALAVGVVLKVFPIFLLPIFIWKSPRKDWWKLGVLFVTIVAALNLPYALMDFQAWIFPYTWQISSNFTTGPTQGTYWWIIYPLTGKFTGWVSLLVFAGAYFFIWTKMRKAHFFDLCLLVITLFLLTDRIYSPQYNLYLLPFLVLATIPISRKLFYFIEIPNFVIVFLLFFLKEHWVLLQLACFIRYGALLVVLYRNYCLNATAKFSPLALIRKPAS